MSSLRVALLEDEHLFRQLLSAALARHPGLHMTGDFAESRELLHHLQPHPPDVVILDLVLGEMDTASGIDGFAVGSRIRQIFPQCGIVLLSNHADPSVITRLPDADASGWAYLLKRRVDRIDTLVDAIHAVARGDVMIDPVLIDAAPPPPGNVDLTPHQMRVLSLLASGLSNSAIAAELGVTAKSVEHAIGGTLQSLDISAQDPTVNARVVAAMNYLRIIAGSQS
jgi:DNA-binding NarL/FixJ family response regulator